MRGRGEIEDRRESRRGMFLVRINGKWYEAGERPPEVGTQVEFEHGGQETRPWGIAYSTLPYISRMMPVEEGVAIPGSSYSLRSAKGRPVQKWASGYNSPTLPGRIFPSERELIRGLRTTRFSDRV